MHVDLDKTRPLRVSAEELQMASSIPLRCVTPGGRMRTSRLSGEVGHGNLSRFHSFAACRWDRCAASSRGDVRAGEDRLEGEFFPLTADLRGVLFARRGGVCFTASHQ